MTKRLSSGWQLALVCFVFILQKIEAKACATVQSIDQFALRDHVYKTTSGTQLISCSAACSEDMRCYSFNFILPTETCELNTAARSAVNPHFFVRRANSLYFDKLQTAPSPGACASSPCKNGGTCSDVAKKPGFECRCHVSNSGRSCEACSLASALGMEDGRISDWSITASASFRQYVPNNSRLHSNSSWVSSNINQFLQISFQPNFKLITGVATQGDPQHGWWVTRYQLKYSEDAIDWHWYGYGRSHRLEFVGNSNGVEVKRNNMTSPFKAMYVQLLPVAWQSRIALRVELYGCEAK